MRKDVPIDGGLAGGLSLRIVKAAIDPRIFPCALLAVAALGGTARLAAQDVTMTPLAWVNRDQPDQLPVLRDPLHPGFPRDLRNTPDFGYVAVEFFVNEKGKFLGGRRETTSPAYLQAVSPELAGVKFQPGRRAGQPVSTHTQVPMLFQLDGLRDGGDSGLTIEKGRNANTPSASSARTNLTHR